jgi:hypothetical protein
MVEVKSAAMVNVGLTTLVLPHFRDVVEGIPHILSEQWSRYEFTPIITQTTIVRDLPELMVHSGKTVTTSQVLSLDLDTDCVARHRQIRIRLERASRWIDRSDLR